VVDLPGHGDEPAAVDYSYGAMVEDVVRRSADLPPFPLVGWSVGATVAWLLAARHPDRVTHLILLDPAAPHQSPFRLGPPPEPVHSYTFASVGKAKQALGVIFPSVSEADVRALYRQNERGRWEPRYDPAILPAIVIDARDHGEEMFFELEQIGASVLMLRGERSFMQEKQVAELAAMLPNAITEVVPNAGHFMVRERPDYVAKRVASFVLGPENR
jgi:abhydrolase domain-containing protein 6